MGVWETFSYHLNLVIVINSFVRNACNLFELNKFILNGTFELWALVSGVRN